MDAVAENGINQPATGRSNLSGKTKFSGANGSREIFIFPVQLTRRARLKSFTGLIPTLSAISYDQRTEYSVERHHGQQLYDQVDNWWKTERTIKIIIIGNGVGS